MLANWKPLSLSVVSEPYKAGMHQVRSYWQAPSTAAINAKKPRDWQSNEGVDRAHLQKAVKVPLLVGSKALHQHADFAGQVGLELQVTDFQIVQQLLGQGLDVALIHQGIYQFQSSPPANVFTAQCFTADCATCAQQYC